MPSFSYIHGNFYFHVAFHNSLTSCRNLTTSPWFQMHEQSRLIPHQICLLVIHPLLALFRPFNIKMPQEPRKDISHLCISQIHRDASARAVRKRLKALSPITIKFSWTLTLGKPALRMEFVGMLPVSFAAVEDAVRDAEDGLPYISQIARFPGIEALTNLHCQGCNSPRLCFPQVVLYATSCSGQEGNTAWPLR